MFRRLRVGQVSLFVAFVSIGVLLSACGSSGPPPPPQATEVVSYTFSPPSPATLKFGEYVNVELTYTSGHSTPIRMWAQIEYDGPITQGTLSYCPSPPITAKQGTEQRCFRVTDAYVNGVPAPLDVDTVELTIKDQNQTVELFRELVTVDYTWVP